MNDPAADDFAYDLAPEPVIRKPADLSSQSATPKRPPTLGYRTPVAAAIDKSSDRVRDFQMPMWLLIGGILIEIVSAYFRERSFTSGLIDVGGELIIGTGLMLAGVLIAARSRSIQLGSLPTAAFKLAAISVAPGAVQHLLNPALAILPLVGGLIGWGISFVLYFALLGAMFDLDESDTWYCVWVIFLVKLAVAFTIVFGLRRWM